MYTYEQLLAIGDRYFPLSEALRAVVERCDIRRAVLERTANAFRPQPPAPSPPPPLDPFCH